MDLRYIGTLSRKQWDPVVNINQPNFLYNGLKEAFDAARAGDDSSPALKVLEDMFKGMNIAGTGFGPVGAPFGGVQQTAGMHLRANTTLRNNLANGNYNALAASLNTLNYASTSWVAGHSDWRCRHRAPAKWLSRELYRDQSAVRRREQFDERVQQQLSLSGNPGHDAANPRRQLSVDLHVEQEPGYGTSGWPRSKRIRPWPTGTPIILCNRTRALTTSGPTGRSLSRLGPTSSSCQTVRARWHESSKAGRRAGSSTLPVERPRASRPRTISTPTGQRVLSEPSTWMPRVSTYDTGTTFNYLPKGAYIVDDDPQCAQVTTRCKASEHNAPSMRSRTLRVIMSFRIPRPERGVLWASV